MFTKKFNSLEFKAILVFIAAIYDLGLGAHCDEMNERKYCAHGLVCHQCPRQDASTCVICTYLLSALLLIQTAWERGGDQHRDRNRNRNRKPWVLVPVPISDQCQHFYIVLDFPFGPCTGPRPIPLQYEYTINII